MARRRTPSRKDRTPRDGGVRREFFELTEGQLEGMLDAVREDNPRIGRVVGRDMEIECEVTRSNSGGRHLYVTIQDGGNRLLHVARDGGATEVEASA